MVGEATRRRRRRSGPTAPTGSTVEGAVRVRPPDPSTTQVLRYRFDALLSRGPMGVILLLLVITLAFVAAAAAVLSVAHQEFGGTHKGLGEDFWQSMLRVL